MSDEIAQPGRFPGGFLWGAATSAYQIEGAPLADGAGRTWSPHTWSNGYGLLTGGLGFHQGAERIGGRSTHWSSFC